MVHSGARLKHPMIRNGDAFHEVSWDDALSEVAKKLEAVKAKYGPEAFLIQTGWPMVRHPLVNWLHRFARAGAASGVGQIGVFLGVDEVGEHRCLGVRHIHAAHGDGDDLRA